MTESVIENLSVYDGRILVVDDNPVNITLMKKILQGAGYCHVEATANPVEVAARYRQQGYDLILLDIHMPNLNGFEVMQQLSLQGREDYLPILVLTADTSIETRLQALASGAKDFIRKPFEASEVLLRVRNILEVRLLHNKVREQNEQLEDKVRERTAQLHEAQVKLIQCLGKAAEYRDNETGMHVVRMSQASALLAKQMGLSEVECDLILMASPMHDIGKLAIPDSVLLKPGKLDGDEWQTMRSHAAMGAEILQGYDTQLLTMAAQIARTHHERWDGYGYPQGLKGEQIPLYTRIVSVCDVFDALTSERPYKPAWSVERALAHMRDNSGKHFDPEVLDSFFAIVDQVLDLRERYPDSLVGMSSSETAEQLIRPH